MSMCNNRQNSRMAGPIIGNPMNGLCERICIEVPRVYDGCVSRTQNENLTASLTDFTPQNLVPPFTYIGCVSYGNSTISNLSISPLSESRQARVKCDVNIPILCTFTDSNGITGQARGVVTIEKDIVLCVPENSVMSYSIESNANLVSSIGTFTSDTTINFTCCLVLIIKVLTIVDILVPTYGYTDYPPCMDFSDGLCEEIFNLPLFPSTNRRNTQLND